MSAFTANHSKLLVGATATRNLQNTKDKLLIRNELREDNTKKPIHKENSCDWQGVQTENDRLRTSGMQYHSRKCTTVKA